MNTTNWTMWLAVAMLYCALTYNPLYQLLLFASICMVAASRRQPLGSYIKLGLAMSAIPFFINAFFVHYGKSVLLTVPHSANVSGIKVPLFFIAGPITSEAIAFAFIVTVFLLNMLCAFQVFNGSTSPDAILRLIPRQMPAIGLVSSIAFRFIPTVVRDHSSIRDAQVSRGVRLGTGSAWERTRNQLGIIAPTVVTALERGFNMSESMASRGYAGERTAYRKEIWTAKERITSAMFAAAMLALVYVKYSGLVDFWPYDSAPLPPVSALALLPILALAVPAFLDDESGRT